MSTHGSGQPTFNADIYRENALLGMDTISPHVDGLESFARDSLAGALAIAAYYLHGHDKAIEVLDEHLPPDLIEDQHFFHMAHLYGAGDAAALELAKQDLGLGMPEPEGSMRIIQRLTGLNVSDLETGLRLGILAKNGDKEDFKFARDISKYVEAGHRTIIYQFLYEAGDQKSLKLALRSLAEAEEGAVSGFDVQLLPRAKHAISCMTQHAIRQKNFSDARKLIEVSDFERRAKLFAELYAAGDVEALKEVLATNPNATTWDEYMSRNLAQGGHKPARAVLRRRVVKNMKQLRSQQQKQGLQRMYTLDVYSDLEALHAAGDDISGTLDELVGLDDGALESGLRQLAYAGMDVSKYLDRLLEVDSGIDARDFVLRRRFDPVLWGVQLDTSIKENRFLTAAYFTGRLAWLSTQSDETDD